MHFQTALVALFAAVAAAETIDQLVAQIPSCATPCLASAAKSVGCGVSDANCQCEHITDLTKSALMCVSGACNQDDLKTTSETSTQICLAVAQQAGDSASSSALASASGAATSAASSLSSTASSATASATPAAAAHAGAGMGLVGAAAFVAFAL
ncbi:Uu.00g096030.m01.CDS01 [Anthostomella pinea]|uniref:Uu.00g096030.m01.CDS01 n=1 Tax=Anthostomella pinea TaxID=933095 RepID=A0AAI8VC15_9PEZI|nr:Uu.00g096030.m01.CDS01 [Anthostomella pinea]